MTIADIFIAIGWFLDRAMFTTDGWYVAGVVIAGGLLTASLSGDIP
jgi:hypothetical protein